MCEEAVIYFLYYFASGQNLSSALGGDQFICSLDTAAAKNMLLLASCWGRVFSLWRFELLVKVDCFSKARLS